MRHKLFLCLCVMSHIGVAVAATPIWEYDSIIQAVRNRDLDMLKGLVRNGYDVNVMQNGISPLCETVYTKDYIGYEMLISQGATTYSLCMQNMPESIQQDFFANQPKPGTYYEGKMDEAHLASQWGTNATIDGFSVGSTELLVGALLLGGAAAGAAGLGGSSGGGARNPDDSGKIPGKGNDLVWDSPYEPSNEDIESYKTVEYGARGGSISTTSKGVKVRAINFLDQINAAPAYARGYTGYVVSRSPDGTLIGEGAEAISSTTKVKVAVLDEGISVNHSEIQSNISDTGTAAINFVYGACKSDSDTNCWKQISTLSNGKVQVKQVTTNTVVELDKATWDQYRYATTLAGNYTYSSTDISPLKTPQILYNSSNKAYGYLIESSVVFSQYGLYETSPVGLKLEDLAVKYTYTNTSTGQSTNYSCNVAVNRCARIIDEDLSKYQVLTDTELATLKQNGRFSMLKSYEIHGTHVIGLIAGTKQDATPMHGVAYNAEIIPIQLDLSLGEHVTHISDAIDLGAEIVNLSLAPETPETSWGQKDSKGNYLIGYGLDNWLKQDDAALWKATLKKVAENNTILVWAAGNYSNEYTSSAYASFPLTTTFGAGSEYDLTNLMLAVVSVNSQNVISEFSAICGQNKNWCIAAPGGDNARASVGNVYEGLLSSVGDSDYVVNRGTSMATPIVSGALAVIKAAFPHLTNQQVVQILLETATDLGVAGVDEIYGHGLLNLDAATSPVGKTSITLYTKASGAAIDANGSKVTVPATLSKIINVLPEHIVISDKYTRAFEVLTSSFVSTVKHENKLEGRFKSMMAARQKQFKTDRFSMAWAERQSIRSSDMAQGFIKMDVAPFDKMSLTAFYNEDTSARGGTYLNRAVLNPFTRMKEAWGMGISYTPIKDLTLHSQWMTGQNAFVDEDDWKYMNKKRVTSVETSIDYTGLKNTTLKFVSGITNEQSSFLGLWGTGAFKSGNSITTFVGGGASWNVSDTFQLEGMYYYGMTKGTNQNALMNVSDLISDSVMLSATYIPNRQHTYGITFVSPMRIRSGKASLDLPIARDLYDDLMYRSVSTVDLKPSSREYDIGFYFGNQMTDSILLQSEVGVRFNPDHQSDATPDYRGLLSIKIEL